MSRIKFGFTLTELLIVMGVLAVLTSVIAYTAIIPNIRRSQDNKRKVDLDSLRGALEIYYNDLKSYPTTLAGITALVPSYMTATPADPTAGRLYPYTAGNCTGSVCTTYKLCAYMDIQSNRNTICNTPVVSCGNGLNCNYGIIQP